MGMRALEERVSQCPDLQRSREPGTFWSCAPLCADDIGNELWAKHLHPGSHQRALMDRITSQGQSLMTNSTWSNHSHPSPRKTEPPLQVLHWVAAGVPPVVEEDAATPSATSLRIHHHPWCLRGWRRKWKKTTSLFTAPVDRCHPTSSLTKSCRDFHNKAKKKWGHLSKVLCFFLITS